MKVLLISANTESINIVPIPLGLNHVAAATQNSGHEVYVLDLMAHADFRLPVKKILDSFNPDIIGVSVRNIDDQVMHGTRFLLAEVQGIIRYCRGRTGIPIILGGAGYSIFPQAVLDYLGADMGIQGEGEAAFPLLLDRLERHAGLEDVPGLYVKGPSGKGKRLFIKDLDDLHVSGADRFALNYDRSLWMPFQTRRGCPMNCSYCSTAVIEGHAIRKRSAKRAVAELKQLSDAGFRQFYFVDNTFNLPESYAEELCRCILRLKLDITWRCILYPGKVGENLIRLMADAGCVEVSLGFESGCKRILKNMNKHFTPEEARRTSIALNRCGIRQMGFLLLGGPGEDRASVLESLAFADSMPLDSLKVTQGIRIYPFTTLAKIAAREGRIKNNENLLMPVFYMIRELEDWLRETIETRSKERPQWIT